MSCIDDSKSKSLVPTPPVTARNTRFSYRPINAKTVFFYRDGQPKKGSVRVAVHPTRYRSIDALFNELTYKMPELSSGVRAIFTPRGRNRVESLDQLDQEGRYICSTNERRAQGIPQNQEALTAPPSWRSSGRPVSGRRPMLGTLTAPTSYRSTNGLHRQNGGSQVTDSESSTMDSSNSYSSYRVPNVALRKTECKRICVYRQTEPSKKHVILLNRKTAHNFEQVVDDMSDIFSTPVRRVYTEDGVLVESLSAIFNGPTNYVITAASERFKNNSDAISGTNTASTYKKANGYHSKELKPKKSTSKSKGEWTVFVTTHSGDENAGTTANTFIVVYGRKGCTKILSLTPNIEGEEKPFATGTTQECRISVGSIGEIFKIRLSHDNTGDSPSWLIGDVKMVDCDAGEELLFRGNRWMSREKGDTAICRELAAVRPGNMSLPIVHYLVTLTTGDCWNAETKGLVHMVLYGEYGDTGERQMLQTVDNEVAQFAKGSSLTFELEAVYLGGITSILIGHDAENTGFGWFLEKVSVKEIGGRRKSSGVDFMCNRWLDAGQGDGRIEAEFFASNNSAAMSYDKKMWHTEKWKFQTGCQLLLYSLETKKPLSIHYDGSVDALGDESDKQSTLILTAYKNRVISLQSGANRSQSLCLAHGRLTGQSKDVTEAKSRFTVRFPSDDRNIMLESTKNSGQFVRIGPTGDPAVSRGNRDTTQGAVFTPYCKGIFRDKGVIMLWTSITQTLSVDLDNSVHATGGRDELAHFRVHKVANGSVRMFESMAMTDQYLRVKDNRVECTGTGDLSCHFRVVRFRERGRFALESVMCSGNYVGITADGYIELFSEISETNTFFYPEIVTHGREKIENQRKIKTPYYSEKETTDIDTENIPEDNGTSESEFGAELELRVTVLTDQSLRNGDIMLILYGDEGNSGPVHLGCSGTDQGLFMAGNMDDFDLKIIDVGDIYKIRLELIPIDASIDSFWSVQDIVIENLTTSERDTFSIEGRPIYLNSEDCQLTREVAFASSGEDCIPLVQYEITLETGDIDPLTSKVCPAEGKNLDVRICLYGDRGDSGLRTLFALNRMPVEQSNMHFQRGQVDTFRVEAVHLGRLKHCLVQVLCQESGQGWYCEKILVQDPITEKETVFNCKAWLLSEEEMVPESQLLKADGYLESAAMLEAIVYQDNGLDKVDETTQEQENEGDKDEENEPQENGHENTETNENGNDEPQTETENNENGNDEPQPDTDNNDPNENGNEASAEEELAQTLFDDITEKAIKQIEEAHVNGTTATDLAEAGDNGVPTDG